MHHRFGAIGTVLGLLEILEPAMAPLLVPLYNLLTELISVFIIIICADSIKTNQHVSGLLPNPSGMILLLRWLNIQFSDKMS